VPFPNPDTQFQPGQSGNPAGLPKGYKKLSTWINELLNDEQFEVWMQHPKEGVKLYKGAPGKAIVQTAIQKAAGGDDKAREWLAKYSEGSKLQLSNDPENPLPTPIYGGLSGAADSSDTV
jgi:hypothetical protein